MNSRNILISVVFGLLCMPSAVWAYDYEPQPAKAMIMMICAHPDDEGIFFGGVMAYYPQVLQVPSVFINITTGEWAYDHSGVLNPGQEVKPVEFPECVWRYGFPNEAIMPLFQQTRVNHTIERSWQDWSNGPKNLEANDDVEIGKQRASRYLAEQIRLYQPEVIVVQDFNGEYGHPNHKTLAKATEAAWDLAAGNDTTISDGTGTHAVSAVGIAGDPWQVKKMYVHFYGENRLFHNYGEDVTIDSDGDGIPDISPRDAVDYGLDALSYTGGADVSTVYESDDNYEGDHSEWWGLYRTTVGNDTVQSNFTVPGDTTGSTYSGWARGDFLENITYTHDAAEAPLPHDRQTQVDANPQLQWSAGSGAVQHDVYFGTDHAAVANGTTASPAYVGRQAGLTVDPGTLAELTTYYWRIDEVQADLSVVRGWVWEFSTVTPPPPPPSLVNGDFETGDLSGWSTLAWLGATDLAIDGAAPLSGAYALTTGPDSTVRANTQEIGSFTEFEFSMLFRIESFGTGGTARAMDWNLSSIADGDPSGDLRFKVDGGGIIGIGLNGGTAGAWAALEGGTFNPIAGTTYRWAISGTGFDGTGSASFDIRIFDGATEVFTSTGNTFTSAAGDAVQSVNFIRGGNWGGGGYTVDDLSIDAALLDVDSDGLDDRWEDLHFGNGDGIATTAERALQDGTSNGYPASDGDDLDNLGEFVAGTDPNNHDTIDCAINGAASSMDFTVPTAAGPGYESLTRRYQLLFSEDLVDWSTVVDEGIGDGTPLSYPIPDGLSQGFYRLYITID